MPKLNPSVEYAAQHPGLQELEKAERTMWGEKHGLSTPLDSALLFAEVEKQAKSPSATEQDTKNYAILNSLREKQAEMASVIDSDGAWLQWHTKPLPSNPVVLNIDPSVDRSRFWAVIIGVNDYHRTSDWALHGACADAVSVYDFLAKDLGIPAANLKLLLSPTSSTDYPNLSYVIPTRANILTALYEHLRDNADIHSGDNIIIYYSGHGARYDASKLFNNTKETIEALCPADRDMPMNNGEKVLDISDREISIFLEELRDAHGNHVTVVFDCCHSGGATRVAGAPLIRAVDPLPVLPKALLDAADQDGRRKRTERKAFTSDWDWDSSTSVLLAACMAHETAKEFGMQDGTSRGYFTIALVALLPALIRDGKTYAEVCKAVTEYMPAFKDRYVQNPLVVGDRQGCKLYEGDGGCCIA